MFGIFGHPEAANLTYLGLYALQHRGQESAGIATADGEKMRVSRAMGQVAEAFTERRARRPARAPRDRPHPLFHRRREPAPERAADPDRLRARPDRRSRTTATSSTPASCATSWCATDRSSRPAATPRSCCTSTRARRRHRSKTRSSSRSRRSAARSRSSLLTKNRLIAARDPHGFRPLALGRLGDAWIVCSETCALDLIGATYVRDVEPGEVLVISDGGLRSIHPFPPAPLSHCVFEHVYFARPDSYVFGRSVNEVRTEFGEQLAKESRVAADVVVPIPDSGVCAAIGYAAAARPAAADGPDPQPLRRPHVHPAAAVDPPLQRPREAEPGPQHPRGQAGRPDRRLDRARHDEPQDREDGARGRRQRSAPADQLPADHVAVLLRRRHAEPRRS